MSLSERSRSTLYQRLGALIDDQEAVADMLSHFPTRELDEPVTRDHLRAEVAELDRRMTIGFAAADTRMTEGFAALDRRMTEGFAGERGARDQLRVDLERRMSALFLRWFLANTAVLVALVGVFAR